MTHDDDQNGPLASPTRQPPTRGPGRPRKAQAPRSEAQARLALAIDATEAERDAAALAYATDPGVAAEIRLLRAEVGVSSAWASYLRATNNLTHALRYAETAVKQTARLAALRELEGIDRLTALEARSRREDGIGRGS